jgi:hypothetical protein
MTTGGTRPIERSPVGAALAPPCSFARRFLREPTSRSSAFYRPRRSGALPRCSNVILSVAKDLLSADRQECPSHHVKAHLWEGDAPVANSPVESRRCAVACGPATVGIEYAAFRLGESLALPQTWAWTWGSRFKAGLSSLRSKVSASGSIELLVGPVVASSLRKHRTLTLARCVVIMPARGEVAREISTTYTDKNAARARRGVSGAL